MKKILLICLMLFAVAVSAQTTVNLTADTTGTLAGSATGTVHTFTSPIITGSYSAWSIEVYVTASGTHATDSTRVQMFGSMDGTNYFPLTYALMGVPRLTGVAYAAATTTYYQGTAGNATTGARLSSAGTGAGGWVWNVTSPIPYRYISVKISQYKAASVLTVNKCRLHLNK